MTQNSGNNNPDDPQNLALEHYKKFLAETAKTLGVSEEFLGDIEGMKSPDQVNAFIQFLVDHFGVKRENFLQPEPPKKQEKYLADGEQFNEWESLE